MVRKGASNLQICNFGAGRSQDLGLGVQISRVQSSMIVCMYKRPSIHRYIHTYVRSYIHTDTQKDRQIQIQV